MRLRRASSPIRVRQLVAALIRITGGSVLFVLLAATVGLPGEKRSLHTASALADTQPVRRVGSARPVRQLHRALHVATHAEAFELGCPLQAIGYSSGP